MRNTLIAFLTVLSGVAAAQPTGEVSLDIPKNSVLVGEPVVVVIRFTEGIPVPVDRHLVWADAALKVFVDSGSGPRQHLEKAWVSGWKATKKSGPTTSKGLTIEYVLSYDAKREEWPFPSPGVYKLHAAYELGSTMLVSAQATLTVSAPTPVERPVHDLLRLAGPLILSVHQPERLEGRAAEIAGQYPTSVYVQEMILNDLQSRVAEIFNGFDPAAPENPDEASPVPDVRAETIKRRAETLMQRAEIAAEVPSALQPDALMLLAGIQAMAGRAAESEQTYRRVVRDFPGRLAAELAREDVDDTTPPALVIRLTPTVLWPPNKSLFLVHVIAAATDDSGVSPSITLASITCDDFCSPAVDIVDAALGMDDRSFKLRADRKGGGKGRTYTITYEATDAAGNKATATTSVVVPHDQGKK